MKIFFKYLPLLILITFIPALFFIFIENKNSDVVIVMTDNMFIPNEVYIYPGDTVSWINVGTRKHWPASDDHLTHSNYPQKSKRDCLGGFFDACRGLAPGEKWSFIYAFEGGWTYHDHLFPEIIGTVFVTKDQNNLIRSLRFKKESFTLSSKIKNVIEDVHKKIGFFENPKNFISLSKNDQKRHIEIILNEQPPEKVWAFLKLIGIKNGIEIIAGQNLARSVGSMMYRKYNIHGLAYCSDDFGYGCYRGFIESLFLENEDIKGVENLCDTIFLKNAKNINTSSYTGCVRGIAYSLLNKNHFEIREALSLCATIHSQKRDECYDAIFIEYSLFAPQNRFDKNNIWNVCAFLSTEHSERCAFYLPHIARNNLNIDLVNLKTTCLIPPEQRLQTRCAQGLGVLIGNSTQNEAEIRKFCEINEPSPLLSEECLHSAQKESLFQK